ncbi:MAG: shikimate dehydrogenase, partial [Bacteroidales bacterium]|nr:shikimate dehydrogenase [Bacteroidales bacterium]
MDEPTAAVRRYGLLGYPLGHSFSPAYFQDKFARLGLSKTHTYELFALQPDGIPGLLARTDLCGLNVTIPYKRALWPYLAGAGAAATALGAVNVLRRHHGAWWGENTDVIGFERSLLAWVGRPGDGAPAAVGPTLPAAGGMGAGGASAARAYLFAQMGVPV